MSPAPPFAITVCGIEELGGHGTVSHVLSILDPDHPVPEAFGSFGEHAKVELRFNDIVDAQPGLILPQQQHVDRLLALGRDLQAEPPERAHLLVHCHAGISRSTASMALILAQALPDQPAEAILALVFDIREKAWPNLRLMELGDATLGRGGALVEATHALHRRQIERRPNLVEYMTAGGRQREVAAALEHAPLPTA